MKFVIKKRILALGIAVIFMAVIVAPVCNAGIKTGNIKIVCKNRALEIKEKIVSYKSTQGTDYWAVLVAVGIYYNHPEQNRPSMLEAVDDLYDVLIDSPNWQADHIHMLKGSQATGQNVVKELKWLIQNVDSDDMALVYITTHGARLKDKNGNPLDLPPKDEADGADEALIMYHGFDRWYSFIYDDMLNFYLGQLNSQGLCVIIDSCYSGGFNDELPVNTVEIENYNSISALQGTVEINIYNVVSNEMSSNRATLETLNPELIITSVNEEISSPINTLEDNLVFEKNLPDNFNADLFTQGFIEDVAAQGRIVLMSCEEDTLSFGSQFTNFLVDGFWGLADAFGNGNGINSAEESFAYADWLVNLFSGGRQDPTIVDNFPGEFTVTYT